MASPNLTVYRGAEARAVNRFPLKTLAAPLGIALGFLATRRSPRLRAFSSVLAMMSAASMAAQWFSRWQYYKNQTGRSEREDRIDEAVADSFPASDAPAFSGNSGFHQSER